MPEVKRKKISIFRIKHQDTSTRNIWTQKPQIRHGLQDNQTRGGQKLGMSYRAYKCEQSLIYKQPSF